VDLFFCVGIVVGLAMGLAVVCLLLACRDVFLRPKLTGPNAILLHALRPGGRDGRPTLLSRP
jgi:hypothetical protein